MRKRPLLSSSEDMSICAGISANGHTCIKLMERSSDVSCAETWRMFPPSKFQRLHRLLAPCRRNSTAGFASPCCQRYTHHKVSRIHGRMPRGTSHEEQAAVADVCLYIMTCVCASPTAGASGSIQVTTFRKGAGVQVRAHSRRG